MIPSIYAWRPPLSMHILMGVLRIVNPLERWLRRTLSTRKGLRTRALFNENVRGGQVQPSGWCSRSVCSTWSTSLLAHAPKVVRSLGSQQKYCVALSEKSWCDSSVCDEYTLFLLAKWLGFHLVGGLGPSSDQSAFIRA